MIVRRSADALLLITQSDHARLAGAIMAHCVRLRNHPRRDTILLAVAEHDPDWQPFLTRMAELRDELVLMTAASLEELQLDYTFVRLGDLISLAFCTGSDDLNQLGEWRVTLDEERVIVEPDLFGGDEIPIAIQTRQLGRRRYRSDHDLRAAVASAQAVTLRGVVLGR